MLLYQALHIGKSRAKIRSAFSFQFQVPHVILQVLFAFDLLIRLYLVIALDDMNVHLPEETVIFA